MSSQLLAARPRAAAALVVPERSRPGRHQSADGMPARERAKLAVAEALEGKVCTVCAAPATSAVTPDGMPSLGVLRTGQYPKLRVATLAATTDWRCDADAGRGRRRDRSGTGETGSDVVDAFLEDAGCAEPNCDEPACGGITRPGQPRIGELRNGYHPARVRSALVGAVAYCDTHLATRTAVGVDPTSCRRDAVLVELGGPRQMVLALLDVFTVAELADGTDLLDAQAVAAAYRRVGIDVERVLSWRRGDVEVTVGRGARLSPAERVADLGGIDAMLTELADASSETELARRFGRVDGTAASRTFAVAGVDTAGYLQQRLLTW